MKKIESNNIIADYMLNESVKLKKEEVKLKDYEEDVYEVEKIIKKQRFGSEWKYKIKWVGYPDNQCTWEPKDNLSKEMLKDFEIELGLKEKNKAVQSIDSSVEKSSKKKKKQIRNESRRKEYKFDEKDFLNNMICGTVWNLFVVELVWRGKNPRGNHLTSSPIGGYLYIYT